MRLFTTILCSLLLSVSFAKDPPHKVYGEYSDIITKANQVKIYRIQKYPVVSAEQERNTEYIYDYEVTRVYTYDKGDRLDSLNIFLMDTTQFLYEDKRTCPFIGKYAVEFTKGKKKLTIVFSERPCYKVIIFCPDTEIDKLHLDLGKNNKIYDSLQPLASDRM